MRKVILQNKNFISPFNEPARDLRIQNKPLWLHQRDLLAPYTTEEREVDSGSFVEVPPDPVEQIVYRDNLFFDKPYIDAFFAEAVRSGKPRRAAISKDNKAFMQHALPLAHGYTQVGDLYLADLWYFPRGPVSGAQPLVIDFEPREIGYYRIPEYMATEKGQLTFQVPLRSCMSIESWTHIFIADAIFGLFSRASRTDLKIAQSLTFKMQVLWQALLEQRQVLACSKLVSVGRNCSIHPAAVILGPTTIGDNVVIEPGAVIDNCIIGSNVTISQGCQLMLSVVGDGSFLPFRAALYLTTLMENSMVAQNTCLQMCVIGRNTFIGAGNTFTDYNLIPAPIRALSGAGALEESNRPVLGGCVGHNCRIGSGMIIYPARTIESDVVLFASPERRVIAKNISYEESDHHTLKAAGRHERLYPRAGEAAKQSW
ncbi:MAG: multidrug transporter [Chloroflexi bacterium]|nr:multidrug transporter [Chloroflexota bacterium]